MVICSLGFAFSMISVYMMRTKTAKVTFGAITDTGNVLIDMRTNEINTTGSRL